MLPVQGLFRSRTVDLGGVCVTPSLGFRGGLEDKTVDTAVYGGINIGF